MVGLHVISVGGSLIVPNGGPDENFLSNYQTFLYKRVDKGERFINITGGGSTARNYINAAVSVASLTDPQKDWIGIQATRLNAQLLKTIFEPISHPVVVTNPERDYPIFQEPLLFGAGWKPGWSTDYVAVRYAERYGSHSLVNLSDVSHVYSESPSVNPDAERYTKISWESFRNIVGDRWLPGWKGPFDPVASMEAERIGLKVAVISGRNLTSLEHYLDGKEFEGTLISEWDKIAPSQQ